MFSQKALLGLIAGPAIAFSFGAMSGGCPGYPNIQTPTPKPTATSTATPVVTKLASGKFDVAASPGPYVASLEASFTTAFTPAGGKAVTVTAVAARTNDLLSIDVSPTAAATLPTGSGLYTIKVPTNTNTTTLKFTPANNHTLNVYVGDFTGWGGSTSGSVTVTVMQ